jgi:hypothetical protein
MIKITNFFSPTIKIEIKTRKKEKKAKQIREIRKREMSSKVNAILELQAQIYVEKYRIMLSKEKDQMFRTAILNSFQKKIGLL